MYRMQRESAVKDERRLQNSEVLLFDARGKLVPEDQKINAAETTKDFPSQLSVARNSVYWLFTRKTIYLIIPGIPLMKWRATLLDKWLIS